MERFKRRNPVRLILVLSLALALVGILPKRAQSESEISDRKLRILLKRADRIVVGVVDGISVAQEIDIWGDEMMVTRVPVKTEEAIKGGNKDRLVVAIQGGTEGAATAKYSYSPITPKKGQRALFILLDSGDKKSDLPIDEHAILELEGDEILGSGLNLQDVRNLVSSR
jgi:hypothetical protein